MKKEFFNEPIFFERNRVYRIYRGGKTYKEIFNDNHDDGQDDFFPEEWVASCVKAVNPRYFGKRDGVSVIKGTDVFFDDYLKRYDKELLGGRKYDCLVKFLDSSVRLPFQVHPSKEFSKANFNSEYGKTEAWLVVATRENAKLYFGFKDKISKSELSELEELSETQKDVMGNLLYGVDAKVGDVWLIRAGLIHAIGAGCTIIEVQEPTDFTIQPERWCADYHISEQEEFIGLKKSVALDAINYDIFGKESVKYAFVKPRVEIKTESYIKENLITYEDTPCFAENRRTIKRGGSFIMDFAPSVYILLKGKATIYGNNYEREINGGEYFFLPFACERKYWVKTDSYAEFIECLPSKS